MGRHGDNIRKRKDGRWEGRYKMFHEKKGEYVYRSVYGHTYEDVKEKLFRAKYDSAWPAAEENLNVKKDPGEKLDFPPGMTILFSHAAREWLSEIKEKRKHSTWVKYKTVYKIYLARTTGACHLSDSAGAEVHEKISDILSGKELSESLQKSIRCITNQILLFANQKYGIEISLLKLQPVRPKKRVVETLSKAEQARLFSGIYGEPDKFNIALLLCLYTGLRLGEVCALKWTDVDLKRMTVTVNKTVQRITIQNAMTKTILLETNPKSESSQRTIPLTGETVEFLDLLKTNRFYIFGGEKPLEPRTMQYRFKKLLRETNIGDRNFHILRHTFATNCIENGMDVKTLSEILGHSDVKITLNRYVHPTMDLKREQIDRLPGFYGQICGHAV